MMENEHHATRAADWRVYGHNLASESHHAGGQVTDARRLMLVAWEGWTSGEPPQGEIVYELLATLWAMAMSSGIEELGPLVEDFGAKVEQMIPPAPNDEGE